MVIGLANLVIGGRGRDSEDIVVLCFLHHCCVCAKIPKGENNGIEEEKEEERKKERNGKGRGHEEVEALQF